MGVNKGGKEWKACLWPKVSGEKTAKVFPIPVPHGTHIRSFDIVTSQSAFNNKCFPLDMYAQSTFLCRKFGEDIRLKYAYEGLHLAKGNITSLFLQTSLQMDHVPGGILLNNIWDMPH